MFKTWLRNGQIFFSEKSSWHNAYPWTSAFQISFQFDEAADNWLLTMSRWSVTRGWPLVDACRCGWLILLEVSYLWRIKHDDVIKWKHFPRYWPFVRGIHRSPVNSPHKGQWRGALKFSLICVWINGWVNNGEAGDLRCYRAHYDVSVMNRLVARLCLSSIPINLSYFIKTP